VPRGLQTVKQSMSRHRFYTAPDQVNKDIILLGEEDTYHLKRVLRLAIGATVYVFDGSGNEFECCVEGLQGRRAVLQILSRTQPAVESPIALTLGQGLAKGEKFDLVVQKATELGVSRIVPLLTDFTVEAAGRFKAQARVERWRRISLEAAKQCGRTKLVEILEPLRFNNFLQMLSGRTVVCSESGGLSVHRLEEEWRKKLPEEICVLVGPEGGWSPAERESAERAGATPISLGPRILRTETAGLVILSLLQYLCGDLR
jgi:16S rRNA (uracil1498-N3)-methyltransferase